MTFEELEKMVNSSIKRIEEQKKKNPLREMSGDEKTFYERCKAEHGGEEIIKKATTL